MKRFYYKPGLFLDEYNRIWRLSHEHGYVSWTLTDEIAVLPKDFEFIEYVPSYYY